jgi:peptidoglycan/LPS O-acetylase OafA/YrhL
LIRWRQLQSFRGNAGGGAVKGSADFHHNNLDFLRLLLASIVFLYHTSALTEAAAFSLLGRYLSPEFAVRGFFVISGLLIYRSYTKSSSITSYFDKRIRRIYPAYLTVFVLAAIALFPTSTLPASEYFGAGLWKYLGAHLLFLNFLAPSLPGVFSSNNTTVVNGALWTLKIEVAFYIFIPFLHYFCDRFGTKKTMLTIFGLSCLWKYGFAWLAALDRGRTGDALSNSRNIFEKMDVQFPAQLAYFTAGVLIFLYFDKLKHHFRIVALVTVLLFIIDHWLTRGILDVFWIAGFIAVVGFWRYFGNFSKYGDFSYGVYILHWPILQTLISFGLVTTLPPAVFLLVSIGSVAVAAVLLWNFVESKFLARSSHYRQAEQSAG